MDQLQFMQKLVCVPLENETYEYWVIVEEPLGKNRYKVRRKDETLVKLAFKGQDILPMTADEYAIHKGTGKYDLNKYSAKDPNLFNEH